MADDIRAEFEEVAVIGCKAVREFLGYRGANREYFDRARVGAVAMSTYARLRATMANEEALRLASKRIDSPADSVPQRRLKGVS